MVSSNVYAKSNHLQVTDDKELLCSPIAKVLEELDDVSCDTQTIPQENLDLANKFRTSLFPWRGQFSPELVEILLDTYSEDTSVVLDPFVGMGTTLFEASAKNHPCYGAEINPSAVEMAKTVHFTTIPIANRKAYTQMAMEIAQQFTSSYTWGLFSNQDQEQRPYEEFHQFFEGIFQAMLQEGKNEYLVRNILINTLIRYMNSKAPCTAFDFLLLLREHCHTIESLPYSQHDCKVFHTDARTIPLANESVDLIITSPPYINVFNYHQNNRPAMELVGWNLLDIAKSEIGSNRKHRQNRFLTVVQYALDMQDALREMKRLLRPHGRAIIVVGRESNVRGLSFKNGRLVAAIARGSANFRLDARQERKFKNKFGETIYEDILHLIPDTNSTHKGDIFARSMAKWSLLEASKTATDEQVKKEALEALKQADSVQKSPLFQIH